MLAFLLFVHHRNTYKFFGFTKAETQELAKNNVDKPAIIVELKYDKDADSAISQIHRKAYQGKVMDYTDNLLLVGINYDKKSKTHSCIIEKYAEPEPQQI